MNAFRFSEKRPQKMYSEGVGLRIHVVAFLPDDAFSCEL